MATTAERLVQKDVVEIKLCGEWLEQLGFVYGQRVSITTMQRLLVIRVEDELL